MTNTTIITIYHYLHYQAIREIFRKLSMLANVPIEPKEQTELLNATCDIEGVLMAGVPGGIWVCFY